MKKAFKWVGIAVVTAAAMTTTACNTIQGAGEDVGSAGDAVADAAK